MLEPVTPDGRNALAGRAYHVAQQNPVGGKMDVGFQAGGIQPNH